MRGATVHGKQLEAKQKYGRRTAIRVIHATGRSQELEQMGHRCSW